MSAPSTATAPRQRLSLKNVNDYGGSTRSLETERISMKNVNNHGGSTRSLISTSKRNARVKRTLSRQKKGTASSGYSFTNAIVESLADAAQAFLYPESNNKENTRGKNVVNTSAETVEMSDEAYYDEEEDTSLISDGRSLDTRTPPPNLIGTSAMAPSEVKRPIPVSSPRSGFDPVFPSSFGESPIARMRAPPPKQAPESPVLSNDEQSRYSEHLIANKHRKWRRQIQKHKILLQKQDDDIASLLTTCAPIEGKRSPLNKGQEPVHILAQLMRAPCAHVNDVMEGCDEGAISSDEEEEDLDDSLIDDDDDDDSTNYGTSVTGAESGYTDDRESEFTGATESTDFSSRHRALSPSSKASSGTTSIKSVLKASSFGSSSVRTHTPTIEEMERSKNKDKNFIETFMEVSAVTCFVLILWPVFMTVSHYHTFRTTATYAGRHITYLAWSRGRYCCF